MFQKANMQREFHNSLRKNDSNYLLSLLYLFELLFLFGCDAKLHQKLLSWVHFGSYLLTLSDVIETEIFVCCLLSYHLIGLQHERNRESRDFRQVFDLVRPRFATGFTRSRLSWLLIGWLLGGWLVGWLDGCWFG